jgi:hypothetical protein
MRNRGGPNFSDGIFEMKFGNLKQNNLIGLVIQEGVDASLKERHTCLPGVFTSFDPVEQLADIQPTLKIKVNDVLQNLPLLTSVPVRFSRSRDFSITFPLVVGDEVLLIFAERSIDTWLINGGIQNPFDFRKHNLSDAFAFPMCYSQKNLIPSFDSTNLEIKANSGSAKIAVAPGTEIILNSGADWAVQFSALQTAFNELQSAFNTHSHTGVTSGGSSTGTTSAPSVADISLSKIDTIRVP